MINKRFSEYISLTWC